MPGGSQVFASTSFNQKTEVKSDCEADSGQGGGQSARVSWLMSHSVDNLVSKAPHNNLLVVISLPAL